MEKSLRPAIIESALKFVHFDHLQVGDTLVIKSIHLPAADGFDRSILDSTTSITILAVTGLIVAISAYNNAESFDRWVTLPQLKQIIVNSCDISLSYCDSVEVLHIAGEKIN